MSVLENRDTMTGPERMQALVMGKKTDRVPFNPFALGFAAKNAGMDLGDFYRHPDRAFDAGLTLMKTFPWMTTRPTYGWAERGAWEFGGQIVWPDNNRYPAPFVADPVVTSPEQVEGLPDPDPDTTGMNLLVTKFNTIARNHGFPASLPGGTPTTMTAGVLGRDNFLRWIVKYPDAVHAMQRKVTDFILKTAQKTIEAFGIENCGMFTAVPMEANQLLSVGMFESLCKPYILEIFSFYAENGLRSAVVHLCGDHTQNLPHWKDIPLPARTTFTIGHEMDLAVTSAGIGPEYILAGNLDNAIVQAGTTDEVYAETVRCLNLGMKHPGGFMLMPACELPPDTPRENVLAIERAIAEHGFY